MRVLVTDMLWPSRLAKWRKVIVNGFCEEFGADIAVISRQAVDKSCPEFRISEGDWSDSTFPLRRQYDVLICNPEYNHLNQWNEPDFDGTRWNGCGMGKITYMFRHKRHRSEPATIDPDDYDAIFHIFLSVFLGFHVKHNFHKHWIQLFPGGGMSGSKERMQTIPDGVNLVIGQQIVMDCVIEHMKRYQEGRRIVRQPLFQIMDKNDSFDPCSRHVKSDDEPLVVCFSSMADRQQKGLPQLEAAVNHIVATRPDVLPKMRFVTFGLHASENPHFEHIGVLSQTDLANFYRNTVDVYFSGDRGGTLQGWPLGGEAVLSGVAMITTDPKHQNSTSLQWRHGEDAVIVKVDDYKTIAEWLVRFAEDRQLVRQVAQKGEARFRQQGHFDKTMRPVFDALRSVVCGQNELETRVPHCIESNQIKTVAIVGNARPIGRDVSQFVDACDVIIRMTSCDNKGHTTGTKTTDFFFSDRVATSHGLFQSNNYRGCERLHICSRAWNQAVKWEEKLEKALETLPPVRLLPCRGDVYLPKEENKTTFKFHPTVGFEVVMWALRTFTSAKITVTHFSFSSSEAHDSVAEYSVFRHLEKENRLCMLECNPILKTTPWLEDLQCFDADKLIEESGSIYPPTYATILPSSRVDGFDEIAAWTKRRSPPEELLNNPNHQANILMKRFEFDETFYVEKYLFKPSFHYQHPFAFFFWHGRMRGQCANAKSEGGPHPTANAPIQ